MNNFRKYGSEPISVALIHGGPGAAGYLKPVAEELSKSVGIIEPFQTESTIDGQIEELRKILKTNATLPVTLIGHSWGAWLSVIFASENPSYIKKLILVSSGPFDDSYVKALNDTRMSRLSVDDVKELNELKLSLDNPSLQNKIEIFKRFGKLSGKTDDYSPLDKTDYTLVNNPDIFQTVNREALYLRKSGKLLRMAGRVKCPVIAIHGSYDPHPFKGVEEPLAGVLSDFKFYLLDNCGHNPWNEAEAKNDFYEILNKEIE